MSGWDPSLCPERGPRPRAHADRWETRQAEPSLPARPAESEVRFPRKSRKEHKPRPHLCRPAMPDLGSGLHTLVTATAWDSGAQVQPGLGVGSGPAAGGDAAALLSSSSAPAGRASGVPAWPRGAGRGAGSAGPASATKLRAPQVGPASGPRPASLTWAEPARGTPPTPPPATSLHPPRWGESFFSRK